MSDKISWVRVEKGFYRNPDTGVEIRFGEDYLPREEYKTEAWYIYEPQPGPSLTLLVMGRQYTLWEAKKYEGADLVESMRDALADPDYARNWQDWKQHLAELHPSIVEM